MKTIEFEVIGRRAFLVDRSHTKRIRDLFSYSVPGAFYNYAYQLWAKDKADGIPEEQRRGWDGRRSLFERNHISVGLLKGMRDEVAESENIRLLIGEWRKRPHVELQKGFKEKAEQYNYQNECVDAMIDCIRRYGGGLVLSATGTGKTKIAAQFASNIKGNILFVVDQVDLLYQSQKEIQEWLSKNGYDKKVGVVGNSKFEPERVTIATIQTLHKHHQSKNPKFKQWTKKVDVIIIDEIHVQMSRRNFSVVTSISPQAVIGLTATLQIKKKEVKFRAMSIAGPVIYEFPIEAGVEAGVLTQGVVLQVAIPENNDERKVLKKYKTIRVKGQMMKRLVSIDADDYEHHVVFNPNADKFLDDLIAQAIKEDYRVVLLVERVCHVLRMKKLLREFDPKLCYGKVGKDERKEAIKDFDAGDVNLIIANKVFTKGINIKRVDLIIDAAQRTNKNDAMQKYGRGVRLHRKKDGLIYITLYTEPACHKVYVSQRSAFKKAKIPIDAIDSKYGASAVLSKAQLLLRNALRKNERKPEQRKLF